jgi:protein-S-isoprenylcysteine O-methyltransferase Ste14
VATRWRWGNVPVPEPHLAGLGAGIVLHLIVRWTLLPEAWIGHAVGWPLVAGGVVLAAWAVAAAGEVDVDRPETLIVDGPYRWSRNPMYLAWTLLYLGVTFVVNTGWPLLLLPAVLTVTHLQVGREERDLEASFGDEYLRYRGRTRRYL